MANVVGESSSGTPSKPKYSPDVFLSFAGQDTRHGFTAHLYSALYKKGIKTFRDDKKLRKGKPFVPELLYAIEESKISIIVLSEGYWLSKWCLDELVKILECAKKENQQVFPIFYKVEPSDIRDQIKFESAMKKLNEKQKGKNKPNFSVEHMEEWRTALSSVARLEGYPLQEGLDESEFIERIVQDVSRLVPKCLAVGEFIVGIETRLEQVRSMLNIGSNKTVELLLIHGIGGIGKTTLAKALFNEIVNKFGCASFLFNVSENSKQASGLASLQKKLLKEATGEDVEFGSDDEGVEKIKNLLCYKRILLILDDVDEKKQIEKLAGRREWFGLGSRIIITSRDIGLLNGNEVETRSYKMKELKGVDALEYFCWNAFNNSLPLKGFEKLSRRAVEYAKGLPLALKVLGSDLSGEKDFEEWERALHYYENNQHQDILVMLKRTYDRLGRTEKSIFLDIACFFKGKKKEYVEMSLDCGHGITLLANKSLITIEYGILGMHDLIQQMARDIVMEENNIPGLPIRLWHCEDVEAFPEDKESRNIKGIIILNRFWRSTSFERMKSLRILIFSNASILSETPTYLPNNLSWLEWHWYPSTTLPLDFNPNKLVVLELPYSKVSESIIKSLKGTYLSRLNLSNCFYLREIPDVSGLPNIRELVLSECANLTKVHDSVGLCFKLNRLDLAGCKELKIFPHEIKMPSLEYIDLSHCRSLQHFPNVQGEITTLQSIKLVNLKIKKLPESIKNITGLRVLSLDRCLELEELPIFKMKSLEKVDIWYCRRVSFVKSLERMQERDPEALSCPFLCELRVVGCDLSDYEFATILCCFPRLKCLYVDAKDVNSILSFIEEYVVHRELQKSPKQVDGLEIVFEQFLWERSAPSRLPRLNNSDGIVSFQTGQKFPFALLAFTWDADAIFPITYPFMDHTDAVLVYINGHLVNEKGPYFFTKKKLILIDLRNGEKSKGLDAFLVHDCNNVDVRCGKYLEVYGVPCREMNSSSVWFRSTPDPQIKDSR